MLRKPFIILFIALGLVLLRPVLADPYVFEKIHDVQVLVDVTNNTALTDPKRHRVEAIRLLIDLLPEGAYATLWELSEKPSRFYPESLVDTEWRGESHDAALGLHAKARGVDLESAIKAATSRWTERDPEFERALVILMDSEQGSHLEEAKKNESRQAIIETWIPQLARLGIKVYSIALSNKADAPLLEALALGTQGWFKQAGRAGDYSHLMLDLFEQLSLPAALPMRKGTFVVDNEVESFSLVLFHPNPQPNLGLTGPLGTLFEGSSISESPAAQSLYWRKTKAYDLIHVINPVPGQWQIKGNRHPDSRLMVKSKTKLKTTLLPSQIYQGERFAYEAFLARDEMVVTDAKELSELSIQVALSGGAKKEIIELKDSGQVPDRAEGDGVFTGIFLSQAKHEKQDDSFSGTSNQVEQTNKTGSMMLVTEANLGLITRQVQQKIHVLPLESRFSVESSWLNNVGVYTVNYFLTMPEVNAQSLSLYAKVRRNDGKIKLHHLTKLPTGGWQAHFEDEPNHGPYSIDWRVKGETASGRYVVLDLPPTEILEVTPPLAAIVKKEAVTVPELMAQQEVADFEMPFKQLFFVLAILNLLYVALMYAVKSWFESQRRLAGNRMLSRLFDTEAEYNEITEGKAVHEQ